MNTDRTTEAYSFQHVQRRLQERHYMEITLEEYRALCRYALKGKVIDVERNGINIVQLIVEIPFKERTLLWVYNNEKQRITTVLP